MDEQSLGFVKQLIEKTEQGKISWSTGFEDGQFKTLLPRGELAFVIQVKGDVRRFLMLDDRQEVILEETVTRADTENEPANHPKLILYSAIGKLQGLARTRALQVNEKLAKAEKLLAAI
jgi:hypothetical protein